LVCGPFTLALHLLGNDIFLDMFDEPEEVKAVIDFAADIAIKAAYAYIDNGADVIAVVDPMVSQISPQHFSQFAAPFANKVFDAIRARQSLSSLFVCGDVSRNLELMCQTTADCISVDEQIDMVKLADLCAKYNKSFGGNMKLTAVLLLGDENAARNEAIGLLDSIKTPGFVLAPGCDLPYAVPEENLKAVSTMVHDVYQRDIARAAQATQQQTLDLPEINLPDYQALDHVAVDVITLDSEACAPCQYMMEAVEKAIAAAGVPASYTEHKIKTKDGIAMMIALKVGNLPTICIDGEVKFSSIIPDVNTIVSALKQAAAAKGL
jgi:uroporphyrinogen decarboxylase